MSQMGERLAPAPEQPSEAFDTALDAYRQANGHSLHDMPPRMEVPPVAVTRALPWAAPPTAPLADMPKAPRLGMMGMPAAMVPDAAVRLARLFGWIGVAMGAWQRHRQIEALRLLDDRLLLDLGLSREDLRGGERSREALRRLNAERGN